jgi:hypothetical protein
MSFFEVGKNEGTLCVPGERTVAQSGSAVAGPLPALIALAVRVVPLLVLLIVLAAALILATRHPTRRPLLPGLLALLALVAPVRVGWAPLVARILGTLVTLFALVLVAVLLGHGEAPYPLLGSTACRPLLRD